MEKIKIEEKIRVEKPEIGEGCSSRDMLHILQNADLIFEDKYKDLEVCLEIDNIRKTLMKIDEGDIIIATLNYRRDDIPPLLQRSWTNAAREMYTDYTEEVKDLFVTWIEEDLPQKIKK